MPSPFDISVATNTVSLDNKREGIATFTVKNNLRRRLHTTAKVITQPEIAAAWVSILPPAGTTTDSATVRDFPIDSIQQYQVKIAAPPDATPGSYTLKLVVADEVNPDDNFTESPDVLFSVREQPKPEARPFPRWIIPAVIIGLLVIVAILVVALNPPKPPEPTATPAPSATPAPCLVTITADQLVYTRPEVLPDYIFDEAHAGYQLVPVGRLADNTWWKTNYQDSWIQTSVFGQTAEVSGDCANLPILFPPS